jgi:hypothetical protein
MQRSTVGPVDVVEELRLRRWARENYVRAAERDGLWHPIILEEMCRKDREMQAGQDLTRGAVPLMPAGVRFLHSAHLDMQRGELLLSVPEVLAPETSPRPAA